MVMNPIPGEAGTDYPVFTEGRRPQLEKLYSTIILSLQYQRQGSIVLSSNICLASTQTQLQTVRWFSYLILLQWWNDLSFVCSLSTCARRTGGQLPSSVRTGQSSTNSTLFVTGEYWTIDSNLLVNLEIFRWYNIDCAAQPDFFSLNQFIYDGPEEGEFILILL